MAIVNANRVRENTTGNGTGALALLGAVNNYQTFLSGVGNGNQCYYAITHQGNVNEWEVGLGTFTLSAGIPYLSRNVVYNSSNGNLLVNFSAGTKQCAVVYPGTQIDTIASNVGVAAGYANDANTYAQLASVAAVNANIYRVSAAAEATQSGIYAAAASASYVDTVSVAAVVASLANQVSSAATQASLAIVAASMAQVYKTSASAYATDANNYAANASSYMTLTSGYMTQTSTYQTNTSAYMTLTSGYMVQTSIYQTNTSAYKTQTSTFQTNTSGYMTLTSGYMTQTSLYQTNTSAYMTQTSTYQTNTSAYMVLTSGYMTQTSTYQTNTSGYMTLTSGYMTQTSTYQTNASAYMTNASAFATQAGVYAAAASASILPRADTTASYTTTLAWNSDSFQAYHITAQAGTLNIIPDAGSPKDGQKAIFRIKDNGVSRNLAWTTSVNSGFYPITALPSATTANRITYVGCIYNASRLSWDVVAVVTEA